MNQLTETYDFPGEPVREHQADTPSTPHRAAWPAVERAQQNVALSLAKSQRGGRARVEQAETVERIIGGGVAESRSLSVDSTTSFRRRPRFGRRIWMPERQSCVENIFFNFFFRAKTPDAEPKTRSSGKNGFGSQH